MTIINGGYVNTMGDDENLAFGKTLNNCVQAIGIVVAGLPGIYTFASKRDSHAPIGVGEHLSPP